jgi:hypothetical protein
MNGMRMVLVFIVLGLSLTANARSAVDAAQAALEVDTVYCTKSGANMMDYCLGYCEKQSGESCTSAMYTEEADTEDIDQCECLCGVQQELFTYDNVPCGEDLNIYAEPVGNDYGDSGFDGSCCLPALLLGAIGFASFRR